jgi:predicted kinase
LTRRTLRRGALAVLEAEELAAADRRLAEAYRALRYAPDSRY